MKRTLAAIAAALLATGAQAQTPPAAAPAAAAPAEAPKPEAKKEAAVVYVLSPRSQISISGRAWASAEYVTASRGTNGRRLDEIDPRWRLTNNSSFINFRGEGELGYGLKGIAQAEIEFGIDGEGSGFGSSRNSGVGLSHKQFGTLMAGRWDTPMKQTTIGLDPFGGTGIHGYYNTFGSQQVGYGTDSAGAYFNAANRWDRRATNSLNYVSPNINGITVLAQGAVGESKLNGAVPVDPYTLGIAVHYRQGPLFVGAAYEFRADCGNPDSSAAPSCNGSALGTGSQRKGEDQGLRIGVGYANKPTFTKVAAAYEYIDLKTFGRKADAANGVASAAHRTWNRSGYFASLTQGLGTDKLELILNWGWADTAHGSVVGNVSGTSAQYYTGAVRVWLAKNVDFNVAATVVENEANATYNVGNGIGTVAPGSTVSGYGANLRYMF